MGVSRACFRPRPSVNFWHAAHRERKVSQIAHCKERVEPIYASSTTRFKVGRAGRTIAVIRGSVKLSKKWVGPGLAVAFFSNPSVEKGEASVRKRDIRRGPGEAASRTRGGAQV